MSYRLTITRKPLKTLSFLGKTCVLPASYLSYQRGGEFTRNSVTIRKHCTKKPDVRSGRVSAF